MFIEPVGVTSPAPEERHLPVPDAAPPELEKLFIPRFYKYSAPPELRRPVKIKWLIFS